MDVVVWKGGVCAGMEGWVCLCRPGLPVPSAPVVRGEQENDS